MFCSENGCSNKIYSVQILFYDHVLFIDQSYQCNFHDVHFCKVFIREIKLQRYYVLSFRCIFWHLIGYAFNTLI